MPRIGGRDGLCVRWKTIPTKQSGELVAVKSGERQPELRSEVMVDADQRRVRDTRRMHLRVEAQRKPPIAIGKGDSWLTRAVCKGVSHGCMAQDVSASSSSFLFRSSVGGLS